MVLFLGGGWTEDARAKKAVNVTEYELAVLEVLWGRGSATIREITEEIYGDASTTSYATVQKLLESNPIATAI